MRVSVYLLVLSLAGCSLFDTQGQEGGLGHGAKSFDPYAGPDSGAIRLSLQMWNGCAIHPTGEPVGTGSSAAVVPGQNYPAKCERSFYLDPVPPNPNPTPIQLIAGTTYFLNQISLVQYTDSNIDPMLFDGKNPNSLASSTGAVQDWFKTATGPFAGLDWNNLAVIQDTWEPSSLNVNPFAFDHDLQFGNANWQIAKDDTWTLEVRDAENRVVASETYSPDTDFLAENAVAGHSQLSWVVSGVAAPVSVAAPGPLQPAPPPPPGYSGGPTLAYTTLLKYERALATHPTKSFKIDPGLTGDGAVYLTWSQLPTKPFVFPVQFLRPTEVAATCYKPDWTTKVACTYGLDPEALFVPPKNGKYYVPGETINFRLALKDGNGNYLHPRDSFPSYQDYLAGQSNGIGYESLFSGQMAEADSTAGFQLSGPKQAMRPPYSINEKLFFRGDTEHLTPDDGSYGNAALFVLGGGAAVQAGIIPGARTLPTPTYQSVVLPDDPAHVQPGTYTLYWKAHRQFMGERITKMVPFDIPVGQEKPTGFMGRVGNCQICHRGTISMDNVRHGLPVDYVEGCVTCHSRDAFDAARTTIQRIIHTLHMQSPKYPLPKNDCTTCHLTRESAIRPSYLVCASCHPQPHGSLYSNLQVSSDFLPNRDATVYGNCAQQCHDATPPTAHILPAQ